MKIDGEVDNIDLTGDLGAGEISKDFKMVPDDHLQKRDTKQGKPALQHNDTIGLNGNDTIGGFGGGAVMGGGKQPNLDLTNDPNNTLNFYVSALKKEEN